MMKRLRQKRKTNISSWSLYRKILISMLGCTLLAMILSSVIIYGRTAREMVELNERYLRQNVKRTTEQMERIISGALLEPFACLHQSGNRELILNKDLRFEDAPDAIYENLQQELSRIVSSSSYLGAVSLLKKNGSALSVSESEDWELLSSYEEAYQLVESAGESVAKSLSTGGWVVPYRVSVRGDAEKNFVLNIRSLKSRRDVSDSVLIVTYLTESSLQSLYSWYEEDCMIVGEDGTILSALEREYIGQSIADFPRIHMTDGSRLALVRYSVQGANVTAAKIPSLGAQLVVLPDADLMTVATKGILTTLVIVMIAGILFSFVMSNLMSRVLTRPIEALKICMNKARKGDLSVRFLRDSTDEVSWLGESYNLLLDNIEQKIADIHAQEQELSRMEQRMLQAQINPHLLYNSLDTIRYLLAEGKVDDASQALKALSGFFKLSLSKGALRIPIREELAHIELYMQIQRICRRKNIVLELNCEEELLNHSIIKLTLQPIVENAYLYAFVGAFEDGVIRLKLWRQGEDLLLAVTDDGVGMSETELERLRQDLASPVCKAGFGLWNVNQRFRTFYGDAYGLTIDSELGSHTTVTVRLPWKEEQCDIEC